MIEIRNSCEKFEPVARTSLLRSYTLMHIKCYFAKIDKVCKEMGGIRKLEIKTHVGNLNLVL